MVEEMYRCKLQDILNSNRIESRDMDSRLLTAMMLIKLKGYLCYIYGDGQDVDVFIRNLLNRVIHVPAIVDSDESKAGCIRESVPIITLSLFKKISLI